MIMTHLQLASLRRKSSSASHEPTQVSNAEQSKAQMLYMNQYMIIYMNQ